MQTEHIGLPGFDVSVSAQDGPLTGPAEPDSAPDPAAPSATSGHQINEPEWLLPDSIKLGLGEACPVMRSAFSHARVY